MTRDAGDLAGRPFWEHRWFGQGTGRLARHSYFRRCFVPLLSRYAEPGAMVCEIGCGGSIWVPLLARRGVTVWGVDYSETGLGLLREALERDRLTARLVMTDVFDEESLPRRAFDMVFSLGFIEHFVDGGRVVRRLAELLRPGGTMITVVPNLVGVWGTTQRWLDSSVYATHIPYRAEDLDRLHRAAGLVPIESARYFGGCDGSVLNVARWWRTLPSGLSQLVRGGTWLLEQGVCWMVAAAFGSFQSRRFSSHVIAIYGMPPDAEACTDADGRH